MESSELTTHERAAMAMEQKKYSELLVFLQSEKGKSLSGTEKEKISRIFDQYMERVTTLKTELNTGELQTLSQIRALTIIDSLDAKPMTIVTGLKEKIRNHVKAYKPLRELISRPFVSIIPMSGSLLRFFSGDLVRVYREVLIEMNKEEAKRIHRRQLQYYESLPVNDNIHKFALREIEHIFV